MNVRALGYCAAGANVMAGVCSVILGAWYYLPVNAFGVALSLVTAHPPLHRWPWRPRR